VEVEVLRQRFLDIKTTDRFAIFFFAGETSGELGRETPRLYEDACKNSQGGPMGFTIMRIALYMLADTVSSFPSFPSAVSLLLMLFLSDVYFTKFTR
jgi:hypothetical protein